MVDWAFIIGAIGAVTGIFSLGWHISNSRSKVVIDSINVTRGDRFLPTKEVIDIEGTIRNKGNRSTTIEKIYFEFGHMWIPMKFDSVTVKASSSYNIDLHKKFTNDEFNGELKEGKVKLGIVVVHTFGRLKRHGYTEFKTPWLSF